MFRYLIRWLTRYQVIAVIAIFALAIICFDGAAGLGLPALFWCRPTVSGLLAIGFTVALLFALCSFVGFLLDRRKMELSPDANGLKTYFVRTFWLPTVLIAARGVWTFFSHTKCGREWIVLIGYALGIAFVKLVAPWLSKLAEPLAERAWFGQLVRWLASKGKPSTENEERPENLWLHAYAFLTSAILTLVYVACAVFIEVAPINAAMAICILFALILLGYGAVRFFVPRALVLVLFVVVIWIALANQIPRKHQYHELKDVTPVALADFKLHPRRDPLLLDDRALLDAWRARFGGTAQPKLIVVMTSGGGIRASVWTAAVLRELEKGYGRNVRMITGASGGMVGAGYNVTHRAFTPGANVEDDLRDVTADALDDVARYLVLRDVPALFLPWRIADRGFALENAWKKRAPSMEHTFRQLRSFEQRADVPSLIYAPASLDDGRRLLVSNLRLDYLTAHGLKGKLLSRSAVQFFDLFDRDLTVATAARMSASFPWVSSATELPTVELRRIGDAGYFDNYGGFITAGWLLHNRQWLLANTSGVLVVQIRDSSFGTGNRDIAEVARNEKGEPAYPFATRAFSELIAPIQGALQTRSSVMYFRNDSDLAAAAMLLGPKFVETVEIELPNRVARRGTLPTRRQETSSSRRNFRCRGR